MTTPLRRRRSLSDQEVVAAALAVGRTTSPTTDLIDELRHRHGVSHHVAGKAYSRLLDAGRIVQRQTVERRVAYRDSSICAGGFSLPTTVFWWEVVEPEGAQPEAVPQQLPL